MAESQYNATFSDSRYGHTLSCCFFMLFKISLFRERNFRRPDMHHKFCYVGMYMNVVKKGVRLHRFVSV